MILDKTKRPRNVDSPCAVAILYGDWGTSKAYVIGLAFAIAGYSSFWLIVAMSVLLALVGINYMAICRHYPDGGGVYASVYHRSKIIAVVGAFLLVADYIVTASISALSGFQYAGVPHTAIFAGVAILGIGALDFFGPKRTGELAVAVSVPTVITVVVLAFFSLPHLGEAWHNLKPLSDGFWHNWSGFVGHPFLPRYTVSDVPPHTIVDLAVTVGASHLILGAPRRNMLVKLVRGNMILQVSRFLPEKIHLLVYA